MLIALIFSCSEGAREDNNFVDFLEVDKWKESTLSDIFENCNLKKSEYNQDDLPKTINKKGDLLSLKIHVSNFIEERQVLIEYLKSNNLKELDLDKKIILIEEYFDKRVHFKPTSSIFRIYNENSDYMYSLHINKNKIQKTFDREKREHNFNLINNDKCINEIEYIFNIKSHKF